jgi:hypothetical protein
MLERGLSGLSDLAWGAAAVLAVGAGYWLWRRWHRPSAEQLEKERRLRIYAIGRLTAGEILEMLPAPGAGEDAALPPTLVYQYEAGGVTYQVSQALHLVPASFDPRSWIPGWPVQVKFDPANPGNSIIACEHWQGLAAQPRASAATTGEPGG